ncbi:unnamed protein product [Blepharisma stoltei]|uniref:Uncharacterized protein n=1 Tax=Blepharisma stoltei TaxID=1481888 RepID=A0AAU9K2X2_9CILI|nr:unnamed protein product [Blepharisma stoltei]
MGCNASELPKDIEEALNQQLQALESIENTFKAMEESITVEIQRRNEAADAQEKLMKWKDKSDKKLDELETQLAEIIEKNQVAQERQLSSKANLRRPDIFPIEAKKA